MDLGALINNSTSKRVLNLLEPVKLTVWKVMIERVTVVKFRVNYGGGNEKVRCSSKIKPRLRAEWVVVREQSCILDSCCLSPIRRN